MIRSTLALLALASTVLGLLAAAVHAEDDAMVRKTFDVTALTVPVASDGGPVLGALVGYDQQNLRGVVPDREVRPFLGGEHLVDLLRTWVRPDAWEEEGALLEFRGTQLVVRNHPAVVREVEALLYELAAAASQRVLVHVEIREDDDSAGGCRIAGSLELPIGLPKSVAVTSRVDYLAEFEVEIAQASNIGNPVVGHLDEGLVVEAIAHPLLDGKHVLLETYLQFCCLDAMRTIELGVDEESFNQPFRSPKRFPVGRLELPRCSHADLHVTLVAAAGEDVLIPFVSGDRAATLRLHVDALDPRPSERLLGVSALTTRPMDVHALAHEDGMEWPHYHRLRRLRPWSHEEARPLGSIEEVLERVQYMNVMPHRWDEGDERLDALPNGHVAVTARPDLRAAVRGFLREREVSLLRPVELDVEVLSVLDAVRPGPGRDLDPELTTVLLSSRLPTLSGRWASVRLGTTQSYLADYDVEVAQEARIADPIVGQTFGGLVGNVRPHLPLVGRTVRVDLDCLVSLDELGSEPFDSGAQYLGPIEQVRARRTAIDTSIGVPLGGRTLIDAGPDPRRPGARLVLAVSARTP